MSDQSLIDNLAHQQRHHPHHIASPADHAAEADDKHRLIHILRQLHPEDHDILRAHFAASTLEQLQEMEHRMLGLIEKVVTYCCFPLSWTKIWGVIYALDLPAHNGRNMGQTARRLGITRAAISIHAREFLELTNMPPSRWMRSELSTRRSKTAREKTLRHE